MARLKPGRDAKVYISDAAFTASGLVEVTRAKDIVINDEAAEVVGSARDLEYNIYDQGGKDFSIEFDVNQLATDPGSGTDRALLQASYDAGSELFVIVTRGAKDADSGAAIKLKGKVMKYAPNYGEGEMGTISVVIKPTDPDNPPTRISTPLS
jgi:hypothetical protein